MSGSTGPACSRGRCLSSHLPPRPTQLPFSVVTALCVQGSLWNLFSCFLVELGTYFLSWDPLQIYLSFDSLSPGIQHRVGWSDIFCLRDSPGLFTQLLRPKIFMFTLESFLTSCINCINYYCFLCKLYVSSIICFSPLNVSSMKGKNLLNLLLYLQKDGICAKKLSNKWMPEQIS